MSEKSGTTGESGTPGASTVSAPTISLPKGGGAIRGIGEKFAANPVTGTGSMSVPLATSPGRSGFGPQLSLSYDSGAGNGPFGFGWSLSLPSITRKTDKGLPQYFDATDSDVFILSGAEDLVPVYRRDPAEFWVRNPDGRLVIHEDEIDGYRVRRYRPRVEGLFARIERWSKIGSLSDVHWRSISKDNTLTLYGLDADSRIADPLDASRIFTWLICETRDDKGNGVLYRYNAEDGKGVDLGDANERNRGPLNDARRAVNRYLKRIHYGNRTPLLDNAGNRPRFLNETQIDTQIDNAEWMFEVVFDYGEHDVGAPKPNDAGAWAYRPDPFSSYRSGFEVRTSRLCQRVLMFHHFPGEAGVNRDCLVRSTDFTYSDEVDPTDVRNPVYTFLEAVTQTGYRRNNGGYDKRSLPPVEFEYTRPVVQDTLQDVDAASLKNLPAGLDGATIQSIDLYSEGIPGFLMERAGAWFYKRNLSPINLVEQNGSSRIEACFASVELVATKPNLTLAGGAQFMDCADDGQLDLVTLKGHTPGFYKQDGAKGWQPFRPFSSWPSCDLGDPNAKFVDSYGDGHADVLITENDAFVWHASLAEEGFGPARRVAQALDEEKGPRIVFADGTQSIYLADLSGDGLTDIVRIRNGEVCYWPNLGYGRFGAKVTMDNAPWFDNPDQFDQKRIRLADIDGSGTTDIIYLHRDGVRLFFNQSGNSWSQPQQLKVFPRVDDVVSIVPIDLLGNGTACLVWSSPLPGDARRPMRYVNLMGGQKPHLLVKTINNLGAETQVTYVPSTKFYLQDKRDGKPWITRLPFPVHVVEKVAVTDKWRKTTFSSTYSYHHGYFDGIEREFRGFGRVEQVDCESYSEFASGNAASPYITDDKTLYQPPVKTVTWYHTGATLDRKRILSQFEHEYFPRWFEDLHPDEVNVLGNFQENVLPEPDLEAEHLSAEEWREALRACKGMLLRQEVCELDVDALEHGEHRPVKLFSTAYHNCHIRRLQPKALNPHAVFLVAESEAITYHYELDLTHATVRPDPRIAHTLNLQFDEYANILQSVAVVYPRLGQFADSTLPVAALALIRKVQQERHLAYTETRYTDDYDLADKDNYRLRLPCEVLTYELTGIGPEDSDDLLTLDQRDNLYFTLAELRRFWLSQVHQKSGTSVPDIPYQQIPNGTTPEKRLVEHARMLFFKDDAAALTDSRPWGELGRLGLPYETYKLALTAKLLDAVFSDATGNKLDRPVRGTTTARQLLGDAGVSGYLSGADLVARFATVPAAELVGQYWMRSGIAGFAPDAAQHFYLPERYTDPFGNVTTLEYDARDLFVAASTDALGNTTRVTQFDYRVLAPREMQDINDNLSELFFDVLGLPTAVALKGKGSEGDNLTGFTDVLANPELADLTTFFNQSDLGETQARTWLGNATARHVYYFGQTRNVDGSITWGAHPACACGILREQHVSQLVPGAKSPLQAGFEYSDGMGSVIVKKGQAEPEAAGQQLRWIANGKTILNNKGKPVKQYEPYFSPPIVGHRFEEPHEEGVTPVIYYDAAGRTVRTEMPDGSFSRVEFSPWHVRTFDQNDTVMEAGNAWFASKIAATATAQNKRAAKLAAEHANTPALTVLDSLGRDVIVITHNRIPDGAAAIANTPLLDRPWLDERHSTYTKLDAEGKPLWIRDALGHLVRQYITPAKANNDASDELPPNTVPCYDLAGNLLYQHSMDSGDRWTLADAAGKPMFAWDFNVRNLDDGTTLAEHRLFDSRYDALHRPVGQWLKINTSQPALIEAFKHVDADSFKSAAGVMDQVALAAAQKRNLIGQAIQHYDPSGLATVERVNFKGAAEEITRTLIFDVKAAIVDWNRADRATLLEAETFIQITEHDALGRMTTLYNWHCDIVGQPGYSNRVAIYVPTYNQRGVLESETLHVRATKQPGVAGRASFTPHADTTKNVKVIKGSTWNAKGQKLSLELGNGSTTRYSYDPNTFRLVHLYTRRDATFTGDCAGNADVARPARPCGVQNLHYTYDPVGNITHIQDDAQQTIWFANQQVEPSNNYTYDALYRLIEATGRENVAAVGAAPHLEGNWPTGSFPSAADTRNYTQRYSYDSVGNILTIQHMAANFPGQPDGRWTRHYAYAFDDPTQPPSNRLWQTWQGSDRTQAVTYRYDPHGSMLNLANTASGHNMRWDWRDMIRTLDLQGGGNAFYNYDIDKQRTRKRLERTGGSEDRIYLSGYELYRRRNPQGVVIQEIESLHLFEGEQRVLMVDDVLVAASQPALNVLSLKPQTLFRYQYGNHVGSVGVELDDAAQVISYEEFHPYGTSAYRLINSAVEAPTQRYRYTGMERDEETGLGYHGARYYASWWGRWTSCDPVPNVNNYAYSLDSPMRFVDRDGGVARELELALQEVPRAMPYAGATATAALQLYKYYAPLSSTTAAATSAMPEVAAGTGVGALAIGGSVLLVLAAMLAAGAYGASEIGAAQQSPEWEKSVAYYAKLSARSQLPAPSLVPFVQEPPKSSKEAAQREDLKRLLLGNADNVKLPGDQRGKGPISDPVPKGKGPISDPVPKGKGPISDPKPTEVTGDVKLPAKSDPSSGPLQLAPMKTFAELLAENPELSKKIRVIRIPPKGHHIATNKDRYYTPLFEKLFEGAGMGLNDEENLVSIEGHEGPHGPAYNQPILDALSKAVKGLTPHTPEYEVAFKGALNALKGEVARPGSDLNDLIVPRGRR